MTDEQRFDIWRSKLVDAREADEIRERQAKIQAHQALRQECGDCCCEDCTADKLRMVRLADEAQAILSQTTLDALTILSDEQDMVEFEAAAQHSGNIAHEVCDANGVHG